MIALIGRLSVPTALLVYALLFHFNVRDLPPAAGLLPELMIALLASLLVWDIIDEALQWRRRSRPPWRNEGRALWELFRDHGYRPAGIIVLTAIWLFVGMALLGFYVATTLFIVVALLVLGERRAWLIGLLTIVAMGITYATFTTALNLRLPTGMFL